MPLVTLLHEKLADQGKILGGHGAMPGDRVAQIAQAQVPRLR